MDFKYKTVAEITAMTDAEKEQYMTAKRTYEEAKQTEAVKTAVAEAKKEFETKVSAAEDEAKKANTRAEELAERVEELEKGGIQGESFETQLNKFLTDNIDKIKSLKSAGTGIIEFTPKAVGNITTANGTNTTPPAIVGTQIAPIQNVNLREIPVLSLTNNLATSVAAYAYTEAVPGEGDFEIVAEGAAKPQIDFDWVTRYATPVKVAAWLRLTDEAVQDVKGLEDVARNYLRRKHDLRKAKYILYGTGTGGQPTGATVYGRAFSAGPMANAVRFPNFMDVVNAAVTDIATTHNYVDENPYMANLVLVNPVDFYIQLVSAKDERGLPLYPQASLFNRVVIGGITILPEESIPAGKIFVGDMEMYNTTDYLPYTVKIGWINDDFIKNQFVILGESRFHAFVKLLDQQAFIYDDIATIKTAIAVVDEETP